MNLSEGYNSAVARYGANIADKITQAGISKNHCEAACRFYKEGIPLERLQDDFKKWNRYIVHNTSIPNGKEKDLRQYRTYLEFQRALQTAMRPFICPNPLYDDGIISIGELKTQKDARWFPMQNLAYPDANNDFCVCKKAGGYQQFQRYVKDGRRLFVIYDKQRKAGDEYKRVLMMSKNGQLYFWNHFDRPCGTTGDKSSKIWHYIDSLPKEAQIILSDIAVGLKESITNHDRIRDIVREAIRDVLTESRGK